MKKIYLLLLLVITSQSFIAKAQFYSFGLSAATSKVFPCSVPATVWTEVYEKIMLGGLSREDSVTLEVSFGDGRDTTYRFSYTVTSSSGTTPMYYVRHNYTMSGTFTQKIVATAKGGAKDSAFVTVKVFDSCAIVKGKLFVDDNANCIADAGEIALACIPLRFVNTISGDTIMCERWTDTAGSYVCNVPFGTYELTPLIGDFTSGDTLIPTCPASGTSTITVGSGGVISDFAFECAKTDYFDAFINASANGFVPGDTSLLTLWSGDWFKGFRNSCFARSTTITLTLDPNLSYVAPYDGTAASSVSGSVITWTLTGANLNNFRSRIKVATATSVKLGDTLCSVAHVDTAVGFPDPDLSNNTHHYCRQATSAFDPNMKEVSPAGKGRAGLIAANIPMTYTIHFQNTGTAPARGITVIDTLPATLDAASFHLLSSTHNCLLYKDGPVLRFRFNDIYLPDSGTDYYGSMGSITYAIRQAPGLAPGDEIRNRAAIYFDYNEAVLTNYTLNTIEFPTRIAASDVVQARIFPNPAHTELNIECGADCSASLTDLLGRIVAPRQSVPARRLMLPTHDLPSGFYLLQISDDKGTLLNSKIVIQH